MGNPRPLPQSDSPHDFPLKNMVVFLDLLKDVEGICEGDVVCVFF